MEKNNTVIDDFILKNKLDNHPFLVVHTFRLSQWGWHTVHNVIVCFDLNET